MPPGTAAVAVARRESQVPDWRTALSGLRLQSRVRWNESLMRLNTWRIGGAADCVVDVQSLKDLAQLLPFIREHRVPWAVIGKGSNLLVPDKGWRGIVLHLGKGFKGWEPLKEARTVRVGAALADVTFAQRCIAPGWGGMEFLVGVPGTIGGAVAMNAGAHGGETVDFLREVWWMDLDGNLHQSPAETIEFRYRFSGLNARNGVIVTQAAFKLRESEPLEVRRQVDACLRFREEKQPRNQPNCGSVFKNPEGDHAARLIEVSGLKGAVRGGMQISSLHANFIVNRGEGTAADVLALMEQAQEHVFRNHGIRLEPEVQHLKPLPFETLVKPPALSSPVS